ncbi:MAG TPA: ferritin family protein [Clostridia bacterium]|nr:ferritin family protein [Clostridia bacterium]
MKIHDYAMEREEAAKEYYENLSECAKSTGIKKIFAVLAEEEQKHFEILKNAEKSEGMQIETNLLEKAEKLLVSSLKNKDEFLCNSETLEAYEKAIEMEHESIRIYENAFNETDAPGEKKTFRFLADQEIKHKALIENIIEFVTKPDRTVEHAEFARFETED